jgi:predicted DNA-binding protein (MmcQ/YjbR family)
MFALVNLDGDGKAVISYSAGPERYAELLEVEGIIPAPYMARIYWVAVERWDVFRLAEWESELSAAHTLTFNKLPPKTRAALALPPAQQKRLIPTAQNSVPQKPPERPGRKPLRNPSGH